MKFELIGAKERTKLSLTHMVIEDFPVNIPEFSRESGVAGWKYFIRKSLKEYIEPA